MTVKLYRLKTFKTLPISKEKAWEFLSDPRNLKTITPDYMGFKILRGEGTQNVCRPNDSIHRNPFT